MSQVALSLGSNLAHENGSCSKFVLCVCVFDSGYRREMLGFKFKIEKRQQSEWEERKKCFYHNSQHYHNIRQPLTKDENTTQKHYNPRSSPSPADQDHVITWKTD